MSASRILVVDDEPAIVSFATRVLTSAGYDVSSAPDAAEALRIVEGQSTAFDLFVLDVMMPLMRGDELGRRLRQRDPNSKILYFTGFSDRLFEQHPLLWEDEAYVDKPVTVAGLLEAVSLLLFRHTRGPEGAPQPVSNSQDPTL
jgi:two-component system, cell cycle sensor histidine kinase and response regulator CckA